MDQDFFLIRKMKNGDEEAMEQFVRRFYPPILKYCRYHIPDADDAEDIAQETFARFFGALAHYRHLGKASNYLYVIARNLCNDWHGKHSVRMGWEVPDRTEDTTEETDRRLDIGRALKLLPEELQEVLVLHYFQEKKLQEIASICEIGLPLVKYRLKRAKEKLRELLEAT